MRGRDPGRLVLCLWQGLGMSEISLKQRPASSHCALCKASTEEECQGCGSVMHGACAREFARGACVFCKTTKSNSVQLEASGLETFKDRLAAARKAFGAVGEEAVEPIASLSIAHVVSRQHLEGTCDCPPPLGQGPTLEELERRQAANEFRSRVQLLAWVLASVAPLLGLFYGLLE